MGWGGGTAPPTPFPSPVWGRGLAPSHPTSKGKQIPWGHGGHQARPRWVSQICGRPGWGARGRGSRRGGGAGSPKPWEHCGNRWRRKTARGEPCRGEAAELETATAGGEMKRGRERRAHLSPAAAAAAVPGRQSCLQHRECKHSLPGTARCPQLPEPWPGLQEGHKPRFWLNFNFFPHHRGGRTPRGGS